MEYKLTYIDVRIIEEKFIDFRILFINSFPHTVRHTDILRYTAAGHMILVVVVIVCNR